jgi:hypothetical protein
MTTTMVAKGTRKTPDFLIFWQPLILPFIIKYIHGFLPIVSKQISKPTARMAYILQTGFM